MEEVWKKYFDPRVLERLRGVRLGTHRATDGTMVGAHRSPRSGQAVEFSEHRQYTPGDDLRQLDWKVLGRTDKYYLRRREDETTLDCHLLVDTSGSMAYHGDRAPSDKLTYALRVAASLAFVAVENHDTVSLTSVGETIQPRLSSGSGTGHLMAMAEAMGRIVPSGEVATAERTGLAAQRCGRGGLIIMISDLFDDPDAWLGTIRAIRSAGSSLLVIQVVDPGEEMFPFGDTVEYVGLEGERPVTVDTRGIAAAYREEFERHRRLIESGCGAAEAPFWAMRTDQPLHARLPELLCADRNIG